jgi:hypothetical protein
LAQKKTEKREKQSGKQKLLSIFGLKKKNTANSCLFFSSVCAVFFPQALKHLENIKKGNRKNIRTEIFYSNICK